MKDNIQTLALNNITRDPRLQMRVAVEEAYIDQLVEVLNSGREFNGQFPIVYRDKDGNNWLADGYQRWMAHERTDRNQMKCIVREGTFRDAKRFALSANTCHGARRTNADKRKAVESALDDEEWGKCSSRIIADLCGVADTFVGDVRRAFNSGKPELRDETRTGRNGVQQPAHKPAKPQPAKLQPAKISESDDPAKQVMGLLPDPKDAAIRDHLAKYPEDVESDIARNVGTTAGRVEQVKEQMRREAIAAQWEWQKLADQQAPADLEPIVEDAPPMEKPLLTDGEREAIHAARLESKTGVYDAKGRPVPKELLPVFALRSELIGLRQQLGKIASRLKEIKEKEPGARYFDAQSTNRSIDDCQRNMRFGAPYIVCPQCGGYGLSARKECPVCRGAKFVPEKAWSALDDEQKRAAESFDSKRAAE